jgi:RNA polymerase sigma-70 factor, ECF subfamily
VAHAPGAPLQPDAPGPPGDRAAFIDWVSRLVRQHRDGLVALCRREGLGPDDAFDCVQEAFHTFLTLPAARRLVDAPEESRKLLSTIARNAARNRRRLHAVARPHLSDPMVVEGLAADSADLEALLARAEDHVRLAGCMRTLGEVQRAVVTLRMLEEVPGEDVARTLGITPGHVAVLLHRAKDGLHACMTGCPKPAAR